MLGIPELLGRSWRVGEREMPSKILFLLIFCGCISIQGHV